MTYEIVKGYIELTQVHKGKVVKKGGFIEDPERGMLYGILDTKTDTVISGHFNKVDAESDLERIRAERP